MRDTEMKDTSIKKDTIIKKRKKLNEIVKDGQRNSWGIQYRIHLQSPFRKR